MNNAIYRKAIENLRNRINVKTHKQQKTFQNVHQNQAICRTKYLTMIQPQYVKAKA